MTIVYVLAVLCICVAIGVLIYSLRQAWNFARIWSGDKTRDSSP